MAVIGIPQSAFPIPQSKMPLSLVPCPLQFSHASYPDSPFDFSV